MRLKVVFIFSVIAFLMACSEAELHFSSGEKKALSDFQGDWLLINYWAGWCKPCIHEIPELNQIDAMPGIRVFGYNFDHLTGNALKEEAARFNIAYASLVLKPEELFGQAVPGGIPATMLIDPDGMFREWLMGPQTKASILASIEEHVSGSSAMDQQGAGSKVAD